MIIAAWWLACTAARPPSTLPAPPSDALAACHEGTEACAPHLRDLDTGDDVAQRRAAVLRHMRCGQGDAEACRWWVDEIGDAERVSYPPEWTTEATLQLCRLDSGRCLDEGGTAVLDLGDGTGTIHAWSVRERDVLVAVGPRIVVWDGIGEPLIQSITKTPLSGTNPPVVGALFAADGTLRAAIDPRSLPLPARSGVPLLPVLDGRRVRWVGNGVTRICAPFGDADAQGFVATVGDGTRCPRPLESAPRARFDWNGRELERIEGLVTGIDEAWRLEDPTRRDRRVEAWHDQLRVLDETGAEVFRTRVDASCILEDAVLSLDGSRVFGFCFPGRVYAFHLTDVPSPGPGLALPEPSDAWLARGVEARGGRVEGQIPDLVGVEPEGPVVLTSMTRLDTAPVLSREVKPDDNGRFEADLPFGTFVVEAPGFRGRVEVVEPRTSVDNEAVVAEAELAPGDALHWWGAPRPILSDRPVRVDVVPPAAIERVDGSREATGLFGEWDDLAPEMLRAFEVRWDDGEPIAGATVFEEGRQGELRVATGRAVADGQGRGWVVTPSRPVSLKVDGGPPTWPLEPERFYGELRWVVPRSSLRVVGLKPGQAATLAHDTLDLAYTFVPRGKGWQVRRNGLSPRILVEPRLDHVPPGDWTLTAWAPDGRAARVAVTLDPGGAATVRPPWKAAGAVAVVVVDPAGRRVPAAQVTAVTALDSSVGEFAAETDELGRVTLGGLPPGPVIIHVLDHATRYHATLEAMVEPRRTSDVVADAWVPWRDRDHPGIAFGGACVVRQPGEWRHEVDATDRFVRIDDRDTTGWTPEACAAALQSGQGPHRARIEGLRRPRTVTFPAPPRCDANGRCGASTERRPASSPI